MDLEKDLKTDPNKCGLFWFCFIIWFSILTFVSKTISPHLLHIFFLFPLYRETLFFLCYRIRKEAAKRGALRVAQNGNNGHLHLQMRSQVIADGYTDVIHLNRDIDHTYDEISINYQESGSSSVTYVYQNLSLA